MNLDFLSNLRLQNIFGPQTGHQGVPTPMEIPMPAPTPGIAGPVSPQPLDIQSAQGVGLGDIASRMSELYQPQTENIDRFNAMIDQYPTREQPGNLRKIASIGLATLGDLYGPQGSGKLAFSEGMGYGKHNRAVEDWQNQIEPLGQAANIERQSNVNQRTAAYQTISQQLRADRDAAIEARDLAKQQLAEQKQQLAQLKYTNPDLEFDLRGPTVMVMNPRTGQVENTGVPTGSLSELERIMYQHQNAVELEGVRQEGRTDLEAQRQQGREDLESQRQAGRETIQGMPSRSSVDSERDLLPTQQRVALTAKVQEIAARNPRLAQFIEFDSNGNFKGIKPPRTGFFGTGPSADEHQELLNLIYGEQLGSMGTMTSREGSQNDRVTVQNAQGDKFTVPRSQLQQAISQGYTEVR